MGLELQLASCSRLYLGVYSHGLRVQCVDPLS